MCDIKELNKTIADIEIDTVLAYYERLNRRQQRERQAYRDKKRKILYGLCCCGLLSFFSVYGYKAVADTFIPETRDFSDKNLFSDRDMVADSDTISEISYKLEEELGEVISESSPDSFLVLNAVLENPYLTEQEKVIFYDLLPLIEDNPYLNKESAYYALANVDVIYSDSSDHDATICGIFYPYFDDIKIFYEDASHGVLSHEAIHCLFRGDFVSNLPRFFNEGMVELLSNEYCSSLPFVETKYYCFQTVVVKMLCEIVGSDKVLESFTTKNIDPVCEYLDSLYGNQGDALKFLTQLDQIFDELKTNPKDILFLEHVSGAFSSFSMYANASPFIDFSVYRWNELLLSSLFQQDLAFDTYLNYIGIYDIYHKAYFSQDLKEKYSDFRSPLIEQNLNSGEVKCLIK